jgi:alpha-D-ribose 1-methylphosphonate 5-phosphate C-P lyase
MNERIRELAEQATTIVEMVGPQGYTSSYANFDKEKFAELIVAECAALAKSKSEYIQSMETDDRGDQMQIQSLAWQFEEFGYKIKKHFGVEE